MKPQQKYSIKAILKPSKANNNTSSSVVSEGLDGIICVTFLKLCWLWQVASGPVCSVHTGFPGGFPMVLAPSTCQISSCNQNLLLWLHMVSSHCPLLYTLAFHILSVPKALWNLGTSFNPYLKILLNHCTGLTSFPWSISLVGSVWLVSESM